MITVDNSSPVPPFEQVRAQLATQIADGLLVPGTRLPTVRQLADDLGLAVNTVARSYRELEAAGMVETRGRGGTVVTAGGRPALRRSRPRHRAQRRRSTPPRTHRPQPQEHHRLSRTNTGASPRGRWVRRLPQS